MKKRTKRRNKFEDSVERQLRRAKVGYKYESKKIPYYWVGHYTPDFDVKTQTGSSFIIECKGYFRADDKRKLVAVKRNNPTLDIRLVFYRYSKSSIKWCEKHRFPYAIQKIPKEWMK